MERWLICSISVLSLIVFFASTVPLRSITLPSNIIASDKVVFPDLASDKVVFPDLELPRSTTFLMFPVW